MRAAPPAARPPRRATFVRHWLPVLAYVAFILSLSTSRTTGPTFFHGQDKFMHFFVYAGFGVVLVRAFRAAWEGRAGLPWPAGAVLAGSSMGVLDEFYQRFVPGRTSDVRDWVADTAGVLAVVLVAGLLLRLRPGRRAGPAGVGGGGASTTGGTR